MVGKSSQWRTVGAPIAAAASVLLALGAVGYAYLSFVMLCDENCSGRNWQLNWELGVACIILIAALGTVCCVVLNAWKTLAGLLVGTVLLYVGWVLLLLDAGHASPH